jgi:hypothetical protein
MESKFIKGIGIALIVIAIILVIGVILNSALSTGAITRGYDQFDYVYDLFFGGIVPAILFFVFGFLPGLFYYKFGKAGNKSNLVSWAAWLMIIAVVAMALAMLTSMAIQDEWGLLILLAMWPCGIAYATALILLITHKFKSKGQTK